jgi:hypothetical protein
LKNEVKIQERLKIEEVKGKDIPVTGHGGP